MTKKELILINFAEKIGAGNLFLEIGNRMSRAEDYKDLLNTYSEIHQVQELFDAEAAKPDADLLLMRKCTVFLKDKLGAFLKMDTIRLTAASEVSPGGGSSEQEPVESTPTTPATPGVGIDDSLVSSSKTWSSRKISDVIAAIPVSTGGPADTETIVYVSPDSDSKLDL